MSSPKSIWTTGMLRRVVQVVCLGLFLWLLIQARLMPGSPLNPALKLFFWIDPLVLLATWLAAHAVPAIALSALGTVLVTLVFGRVFCGWVCPLGTLHAACGWVFDRVWPNRKRRDHFSPWQRAKHYVLLGFLVMAVLGSHVVCVLDPLVLLYRSMTTVVMPGVQWSVDETSTIAYKSDPGVGPLRLTAITEPVHDFFRNHVYAMERNWTYLGSWLILLVFVASLLANAWQRRFWCRYICPLGSLLGWIAWRPVLRRHTKPDTCNQCDLCSRSCHGAAGGAGGGPWRPSECFGCMNCTAECRRGGMEFTLVAPWRKEPAVERIDLSKRMMLASAAGGLVALCGLRTSPQASPLLRSELANGLEFNPDLIRPPGSRAERDFLERCLACGLCMKICPTGGLQPTLAEAGLEGIWTPRLVPQLGYCDFDCNLCGQVCPTEAIVPLSIDEKQTTRLGVAAFDVTRCIPYAYSRDCSVCEEHCPIPHKAIYLVEVEVQDRTGKKRKIGQPHVDPDLCIGCGVCEHVCPYKDRPGIRVSSANESRNGDRNAPILRGSEAPPKEAAPGENKKSDADPYG